MSWHGSKNGRKGHGSGGHGGYPGGRHGGLSSILSALGQGEKNSHRDRDQRDSEGREDYQEDRRYRDGQRYDEGHSGQPAWGRSRHDRSRAGADLLAGVPGRFSSNVASVQSKFAFVGAIGAVFIWSLLAWLAYGLIDGLGGWLSASTGALLQGGKDAIGTIGIGKDVVDQVNVQGAGGLLQQFVAAAVAVARPAIVFVWFLGTLAILAVPFVLRRLSGFVRSRRH
ncbi:MAG TPA: hypothetical protein VGV39_13915 [Mesorhizobium sp.]|jgi:hypothetical protein|uniref:hypothetical protein n=1 Tax=Mesorhizobium sp. TaxID=1871066 RepID=UPI002DDD4285|nr:hypothetical protein [Mesorhizobium sp.]HEV2504168.1 hypothetical protein [Mesorhizobium sp.]